MPSRRSGTPTSGRSWRRLMREASENSTRARVASAKVRTVELVLSTSIPPSTCGPTSRPKATNNIVGVSGVPEIRREIAATPSSASATMASAHSISGIRSRARRSAVLGHRVRAGLGRDAAGRDGLSQGVVVALVLIGVRLCERRQRAIEAGAPRRDSSRSRPRHRSGRAPSRARGRRSARTRSSPVGPSPRPPTSPCRPRAGACRSRGSRRPAP